MIMKILIAGEPTRTMQVGLDTGVLLAQEMIARGYSVDYADLGAMDWALATDKYFSDFPVQKILQVLPAQLEPFVLDKKRIQEVSQYDVIWQRIDPPVNDRYQGHMNHFASLSPKILQINSPAWNWKLSEHLLPQRYPEFAVPTWECDSFEQFISLIKNTEKELVAKPLHLYSGVGIEFFNSKTPTKVLENYWNKWQPKVAVQPFIDEVTTQGDLRILVMNKKVVGSVLRKPKTGSRLANLHQGGSAHWFNPTPKQLKACEFIAEDLYEKDLYLLGIDFIGDHLTEVNITCPSALPQINQVMSIKGERIIIDEMETLIRSR
jgi:glutathione synthase